METKQSLGAFICRRRKELCLTQRELADRLFVTESAVSKWERGLSYPDITLVRELCAVLEVSEHELLTASEDAEARTIQRLARRYLSLIQTCRRVQYLLYGGLALIFLIANLSQGGLGWLGIALAGEGMAMSLTLIPALTERYKTAWMTGGFTLFLLLLLGACALYSGGDWFFPAALGTLLAEGVLLSPLVLRQLPLGDWSHRKTTLYIGLNTLLLLLLLLVCALYGGGDWFFPAALGTLLAEGVLLSPLVLRQLPLGDWSRRKTTLYIGLNTLLLLLLLLVFALRDWGSWFLPAILGTLLAEGILLSPLVLRQLPIGDWSHRKTTLYIGLNTLLLLLLLLVCSLGQPGSWFLSAVLGVLFAESLCLLPLILRQLPLPSPLHRHKAALWCGAFSVLLLLLLAVSCLQEGGDWFWNPALPLALYGLALPWSLVGIFRYLPCSRWYRGALGCAAGAVWQFCLPWTLQRLTASPDFSWDQVHPFGLRPDFTQWADPAIQAENVMALICLGLLVLGAALALAGRLRRHR